METPEPDLLPRKTARFLVTQGSSNSWTYQSVIKFSEINSANLWDIDLRSGIFTVQKTATYMFALSGTKGSSTTVVGLYLKTRSGPIRREKYQENTYQGNSFHWMFLRKFTAGDQILLQMESYETITTGENTPLTFYCIEIF